MELSVFHKLYGTLQTPVLVCQNTDELPVIYCNTQAEMLFLPAWSSQGGAQKPVYGNLRDFLKFRHEETYYAVRQMLVHAGYVDLYRSEVITQDYMILPTYLTGNLIPEEGAPGYFVLYLNLHGDTREALSEGASEQMLGLLNATLLAGSAERAIQTVMELAGSYMDVSRAYVFEDIDEHTTRNTYEWCADGIMAAMPNLQNLRKEEYSYDTIIQAGMMIVEDVNELAGDDKKILLEQDIAALAILPIFAREKPLGFVGFDDCVKTRSWSTKEILFLKSVAALLGTLIKRRSAEQGSMYSFDVLRLLMDNSDEVVYASSLEDFTLLYVNRTMATLFGREAEDLLGKKCYDVWHPGQNQPCAACPAYGMEIMAGNSRSDAVVWEQKVETLGRTFLSKDNIVRWVDGKYVHVQTSTDITDRIENERQLQYYASTDSMTGVHNREWGGRLLEEQLQNGQGPCSLCFIDLDGLKYTNDHFGHTAGDALLKDVVGFIKNSMAPDEMICRWGGDEFLLLFHRTESETESVIQLVQRNLEAENAKGNRPYTISFSYGIVAFALQLGNLDTLVKQADERMYQNKMEKRGKLNRRRRSDPIVAGEP